MSGPPPVILKADSALGLFAYVDEDHAEELCDRLTADLVAFSVNPPESGDLAEWGKTILVFGNRHPRTVAGRFELFGEEVEIDPDVVIPEDLYQPPVKKLFSLGEVHDRQKWDYAALGISRAAVPDLIRMATDEQLRDGPQESLVSWAPVHAWRALAELRAEEAIVPLVKFLRRAEEVLDVWVCEDLPHALAQFGAVALAPVTAFLAEVTQGELAREAAAETLGLIAKLHPDLRMDCIARLAAQLEHFAEQSDTLNPALISPLMDLRAVEAMPVIERAFASGRVDEGIVGDLEDVQIALGLKTKREHPHRANRISRLGAKVLALAMAKLLKEAPEGDLAAEFDSFDSGAPINATHIRPPHSGPNEPCPCGSGKKYKKCCGG